MPALQVNAVTNLGDNKALENTKCQVLVNCSNNRKKMKGVLLCGGKFRIEWLIL